MQCQPYITVEEFKNSPFYCSFPVCCISGTAITEDEYIDSFIDLAQAEFESYMGWEICLLERKEHFRGDGSVTIFTTYRPIDDTIPIELEEIRYSYSGRSVLPSQPAYVDSPTEGIITKPTGYCRNVQYNLTYNAGYEIIPDDIKQAMCMMVLNLAQRLDNNNANNPDLSIDSININKTATANFGSSKMVKQIVMKSMKELCDLPTPVARILDRYRDNGSL